MQSLFLSRDAELAGRSVALIALVCFSFGLGACTSESGEDGSEILVPFEQLGGNIMFATAAISGSNAYDLFIVPIPAGITAGTLAPLQVTDSPSNEWQPSVAHNGGGIAFVRDFGIHVITSSGRIRQITNNEDSGFLDSLPAVSADARFVAWVREDTTAAIGTSGFFQTYIMMAEIDGSNTVKLAPEAEIIQDAPAFDPAPGSTRIAWSEFDPSSILAGTGPTIYNVRVFDHVNTTSLFPCRAQDGKTPGADLLEARAGLPAQRCFGQHLAWPINDVLVLSQDMLEISLSKNELSSVWQSVIEGVKQQQTGIPDVAAPSNGFFPRFPLSAGYAQDTSMMVFDGFVGEINSNNPSLAFFTAPATGAVPQRLKISGHTTDIDATNTADYLFSVATPQIIPAFVTP
jgi:hypothetical protein